MSVKKKVKRMKIKEVKSCQITDAFLISIL